MTSCAAEYGAVLYDIVVLRAANLATILAARREGRQDLPAFRALVLLENDPPAWPKRNCPSIFPPVVPPLQPPALLVGGSATSPKTDEVGRLFAYAVHVRHQDGHRPLPKDPSACSALTERIVTFLRRHCS